MKSLCLSMLLLLFYAANAQVKRVPTSSLQITSQIPAYSQVSTINVKTVNYTPPVPAASATSQVVTDGDTTTEEIKVRRYADVVTAGITLADGNITSTTLGKVWTLKISAPNATSIGLLFNTFNLSSTAEMYVFDQAKTVLDSCIKKSHFISSNAVGLSPIAGNNVIVYILERNNFGNLASTIAINKIEAGFLSETIDTGFGNDGSLRQASTNCMKSIACESYFMNSARAVARFSSNGLQGTGTLLNNQNNNGKAYFLTAFHVIDSNKNDVLDASEIAALSTARFRFQYWRPYCGSPSLNYGVEFVGATLKASWKESDVILLELSNPPGVGDGVNYAGWNRQTAAPGDYDGYILHHPSGEDMRITETRSISSWFWNSKFWSAHYSDGVVLPGSSGSALFNQYGQVVGQLRSGWSSCNFTDFGDRYGKFSSSWGGAGLQQFLSPSGNQSMNTLVVNNMVMTGVDLIDFCNTNNFTFTIPSLTGCTYAWTVPASLTVVSGQNTSSLTVTRNPAVAAAYIELSVLITDNKGYNRTQRVTKTVQVGAANITLAPGPAPPAPRYATVMFKYNNTSPGAYFNVESADGMPFYPLNTLTPSTYLQNVQGVSFSKQYGRYRTIYVSYKNTCGTSAPVHFAIDLESYPHLPGSGGFSIYPNPANTELSIELNDSDSDTLVVAVQQNIDANKTGVVKSVANTSEKREKILAVLYSAKGKIVASTTSETDKFALNTENVPNGIYYLHLTLNGNTEKRQIIVKH